MKKELLIDGTTYVFHLFEEFKIWRLMENTNLFHAQKLDLEIDLNTVSNFKWEDIESFIKFWKGNAPLKIRNIDSSKKELISYYTEIFKNTSLDLNSVEFKFTGINFKGFSDNVNLKNEFVYDLIFYPIDKTNEMADMGSFVWNSLFRNELFLGVYCDRI